MQGNVDEDGRRSAQQWQYQLHLMHIREINMVYNGLAVVSVFLLLQRSYSNSLWVRHKSHSKYYNRLSRIARAQGCVSGVGVTIV